MTAWQRFVHEAIIGEPDDAHVGLLKDRLAAGARVLRIYFLEPDAAYRILLERIGQTSECRIPHSSSFTRWSLASGARMATRDEEAARFALVLADRWQPIEDELGQHVFECGVVELIRVLGAPQGAACIQRLPVPPAGAVQVAPDAARKLGGVVTALARDLSVALGYTEDESAEILDRALVRFATQRFSGAPNAVQGWRSRMHRRS